MFFKNNPDFSHTCSKKQLFNIFYNIIVTNVKGKGNLGTRHRAIENVCFAWDVKRAIRESPLRNEDSEQNWRSQGRAKYVQKPFSPSEDVSCIPRDMVNEQNSGRKPFLRRVRCTKVLRAAKKGLKRDNIFVPEGNTKNIKRASEKLKFSRTPVNIFIPFGLRELCRYTTPWAIIASATFSKPAIFAPATRSPSMPYFLAASKEAL